MKNNKSYIILIILLIIFAISIYIFIGKDSIEKNKVETTILLNPDTIFTYSNRNWIKTNNTKDYEWNIFSVFLDSEYKGEYYVWNDENEGWYIFDENKNAINYTEKFLGLKSNFETKVKEFEVIDNITNNYVDNILSLHKLSSNAELTVNNIVNIDIDNDGIEEQLYILSNTFPIESTPDVIFSYVFMLKDNQLIRIYESEEEGDAYSGCVPSINSILDVDNDDNYEILLSCARYSAQKPINFLYKYENKNFKLLISSE